MGAIRATGGDGPVALVIGRDATGRIVDPRAVRVAVDDPAGRTDVAPVVLEPPAMPLAPAPRIAGTGVLGGIAAPPSVPAPLAASSDDGLVLVDDEPASLRLERLDATHVVLAEGHDEETIRTAVLLLPPSEQAGPATGVVRRECVVDGWRIEVEIESERRASLHERARRGREATARGGPTEVRAIIPGRVVAVSVVPGDSVVAGQQLLVVEAMKMQNELRAPRDGVVSKVAVGPGRTIEVGDLLLVLD
jgi:biotin carboxyl carrier protein